MILRLALFVALAALAACSTSTTLEKDAREPREEVRFVTDAFSPADLSTDAPEDAVEPEDALPADERTPPEDSADLVEPDVEPADLDAVKIPEVEPADVGEEIPPEVVETDVTVVSGTIEEPFDDGQMAGPSTTALWGGGTLVPQATGFGDGSDGEFAPAVDTVLDTDQGPYHYTSLAIPANVVVTAVGSAPLEIYVQGDAVIDGTLSVSGGPGEDALGIDGGVAPLGGAGTAGGAKGGDGGAGGNEPGLPGAGTGGGTGGPSTGIVTFVAPGGGGGFGVDGADGMAFQPNAAGTGGGAYGTADLDVLEGGSGGGGGGPYDQTPGDPAGGGNGLVDPADYPGAGGGGGGGAVALRAGGTITVAGTVSADGGTGGMGDFSGGGGGGSGGAILLETAGSVTLSQGILSARGGKGNICTDTNQLAWCAGGTGAGGRIVVRTGIPLNDGIVKNPYPVPTWATIVGEVDGGDGSDGAFVPNQDTQLDTTGGPFFFTTVVIPEGVTVTAVGSLPLRIYSQGNMDVLGTVDVSGLKGGTAYSACCSQPGPPAEGAGGPGGPGGYRGGTGGLSGDGEDGTGPGGGAGSLGSGSPGAGAFAGGGAGGGYGSEGQVGGCPEEADGGGMYGIHSLEPLEGGSGGGGAGWTNVAGANPGSGGGGGGGAVHLQTAAMLQMKGTIRTNGGEGGDNTGSGNGGSFGAGGGGGSGGAILVRAHSVRDYGRYEAMGGPAGTLSQGGGCSTSADVPGQGRGGRGGDGRIRFETDVPVGFVFPDEGSLYIDSYQAAFQKKAVSLFYDTGTECPDFTTPTVLPESMQSKVMLSFEGAHANGDQPDLGTATGWSTDVGIADCHRFIRFSLEFKTWPQNDPTPSVESVTIPFTFEE